MTQKSDFSSESAYAMSRVNADITLAPIISDTVFNTEPASGTTRKEKNLT
jgi:hypothetical protein